MKTLAISTFKAQCLGILEEVRRTGEPVLITRLGKPMAEVVPTRRSEETVSWMGSMAGRGTIRGDLVAPLEDVVWEALED